MKNVERTPSSETIFRILAEIGSSFGSAARLKILQVLAQAPRPVEKIAEITGETVGNTSQHLQRLLRQGLVSMQKEKLLRIYRLKNERVALVLEELFDLAEDLSKEFLEAERELTDEDYVSAEGIAGIAKELCSKRAVLIDVRDHVEADETPVEGAIKIPAEELKEKASGLSKNKTYFVFCRGRACALASEGVRILRSLGFKAYRLKESPVVIRKSCR